MFSNFIKVRSSYIRVVAGALGRNYHNNILTPCFPALLHKVKINQNINAQAKYLCKPLQFSIESGSPIDPLKFDEVCTETLESLCDYFEEIIENSTHLKGADVTYGDGVLTIVFGEPYGTYVINRQTPNKQIWLSSPTSGPKRYDFVAQGEGYWIYKHDGVSLHQLLQNEINEIIKNPVDFSNCSHSLV